MIPKKYEKLLFSFLVSILMALVMSLVITWLNLGFVENFVKIWLNACYKGFLVGFPTFLLLAPYVRRLVNILISKD